MWLVQTKHGRKDTWKDFPFPSGRGRKPWLYRIYRFQWKGMI